MELHVHLLDDFGASFIAELKSKIEKDIILTVGKDLSNISESQILVAGVPVQEQICHSQKLHTLIIPWAGLPKRTRDLLRNFPQISVHNIHHNATITAEMTFALMMTSMKRIIPIDKEFRTSNWERRYSDEPIISLDGKHVVVLGGGSIGMQVANFCIAFNMKVSVVNRTKKQSDNSFTIEELPKLLPSCDALLITLPLTNETENLISKEELALLPDDCTIVNIARGKVVDEEALFAELKPGRLRAGLDVWYNYPISEEEREYTEPSKFPFHELDNVVMTPHLAGHSDIVEKLRVEELAKLINQASNGEELDNKVDLDLGY